MMSLANRHEDKSHIANEYSYFCNQMKMTETTKSNEFKELNTFTKFLALKSSQIIVQSRLGVKVRTQGKPFSPKNKHWFYTAVESNPEVAEKARMVLNKASPNALPLPYCVEISLKTVEGDIMTLETWCINVNPNEKDMSVRVAYTVYNRMSTLLRSLITITRITPAYKLSRRQGPDSYTISHRFYLGEPQNHLLGEGYSSANSGQLGTPEGTIYVICYYRTKMTISPQPSKESSIMLKSDHFKTELGPNHANLDPSDGNRPIKVGAFVETVNRKDSLSDEKDVPFSSLLKSCIAENCRRDDNGQETTNETKPTEHPTNVKEDSDNGNVTSRSISNDDFIMVDLKAPFAVSNANTDLGTFYRECQCAPQLEVFDTEPTVAEQMGDLDSQLEAFEISLQEFDEVVTKLYAPSENNN